MGLFGIGTGEVLLILFVALIIWGPRRMVGVGGTLGRVARTLKNVSSNLTAQVAKELEIEEKGHPPKPKEKEKSGD